jgi:hypothetical protein
MKEADRHEETMQVGETTAAPPLNSADYEEFLQIVEEMSRRDGYAPPPLEPGRDRFGPTRTHAGEIWRVGPFRLLVGGQLGDERWADLQLSRWEAERGWRAVKLE